ncbi:MAG: ATP-binding protein [Bacteroidota bacterium]
MKTIALNLLDVAANSFEAGASDVAVSMEVLEAENKLELEIRDNGRGMEPETLEKVTDPFYTTRSTRKVGLGLALIRQMAEATGGSLTISSVRGSGTTLRVSFGLRHPDCQPLGDLPGVVIMLAGRDRAVRFRFRAKTGKGVYNFDTAEVLEVLEINAIEGAELLSQLRELVANGLREISFEGLN